MDVLREMLLGLAALGVTEPITWGLDGRVSDIAAHLAYGLMTAVAYDAFNGL